MPKHARSIIMAAMAAGMHMPALAAGIDPATIIIPDSGDSALVYAMALVGLMAAIPGILLYCAGEFGRGALPRIAGATVSSIALATLIYFAVGYSLVFDLSGTQWIGGAGNAMLNNLGTVRDGTTIAETGFAMLHWVFVALAMALLCGLLSVRARPGWLLAFSGLWLLIVLLPVMRWTWGGGWLASMGVVDAAGGLTILFATACSALVALLLIGRTDDSATAEQDGGLHIAGSGLFFIGMAALAGGATLSAGDDAAVAMLSTLAAAMTGALTSAALNRSLSPTHLARGMVAGTVAIAVAGDGVSFGSAWITGALAAIFAHIGPRVMPRLLRWPDQGGIATAIAGAAKAGVLLVAIFLSFDAFTGSGYAEGMTMQSQLVVQIIALAAIALWAMIATAIAALMVSLVLPMRRSDD